MSAARAATPSDGWSERVLCLVLVSVRAGPTDWRVAVSPPPENCRADDGVVACSDCLDLVEPTSVEAWGTGK